MAADAIVERNEIPGAILAASPFGITLVKSRIILWVNASLALMLGYRTADLIGMPVRNLYATDDDYIRSSDQIMEELWVDGRSKIHARLVRRDGSPMDCEIQMACLNTKNFLYTRMVTIAEKHRNDPIGPGEPDTMAGKLFHGQATPCRIARAGNESRNIFPGYRSGRPGTGYRETQT